jgi:hypothetical protein
MYNTHVHVFACILIRVRAKTYRVEVRGHHGRTSRKMRVPTLIFQRLDFPAQNIVTKMRDFGKETFTASENESVARTFH